MATAQPFGISCKGGLNTNLNQLEMLASPGLATKLTNFEVDPDGGYRRINGYTAFGSSRPNSANKVLGMAIYADGLIICSGTGIFFSQTGNSWLQLNRASVSSSGDNFSTFSGRSLSARTSQGQVTFAVFEGNTDYGQIIITDGANKPFLFSMTGTGDLSTRTFFAEEITVSGTTAPTVCAIHDNHLVVAGAPTAKNTVFFSKTLDPSDFSGSGSGSILLPDQVVGIKSFRNDLIIFCRNTIHKLININDSSNIAIVPVTKNVGCLSSHSIQEIGGDLVFLSPDGIRSVAGTARIGDVELGTISIPVQSFFNENIVNASNFVSLVVPNKTQYRLFFTKTGTAQASTEGVLCSLRGQQFEFAKLKGIRPTATDTVPSTSTSAPPSIVIHGGEGGYIYRQEIGNDFDGTAIDGKYRSPDLSFGDVGTRKHMHRVLVSYKPEAAINADLFLRYDYEDPDAPRPSAYSLAASDIVAVYGTGVYGTSTYGGQSEPLLRQSVEGSGFTVALRVNDNGVTAPYALRGFQMEYQTGARR